MTLRQVWAWLRRGWRWLRQADRIAQLEIELSVHQEAVWAPVTKEVAAHHRQVLDEALVGFVDPRGVAA